MKHPGRWVPTYAHLPLFLVVAVNMFAFYGARLFYDGRYHYISTALDDALPIVPFFVVFYVLAYLQWIIGYIMLARESRELCFRYVAADLIAKLMCFVIFVTFPTAIDRPETVVNGPFTWLMAFLFRLDPPNNLFPSVHCLESWGSLRMAFSEKKPGRWFRIANLVLTPLVFASTVLIRQHVLADIVSGVAVYELGLLINRLTGAEKLFWRFDAWCRRRHGA